MAVANDIVPPPCSNCQETRTRYRRRGLCEVCYRNKRVRKRYAMKKACGLGVVGNDFSGEAPIPPEPTDTEPGSEERILVLMERARLKQALFREGDNGTRAGDVRIG